MDVMEAIAKRRSVRKYLDKPVPWDDVGSVVDAGRQAPSAGNLQNWKFIIVTDEAKRKAIGEACLQQQWMHDAPVHLVVCTEPRKAIQFYGIRGDRLYSIQNCAAAMQNMLLAATSLGLGSCWVGAFDEGMLKAAASIPEYARPQGVVTLGYAAETPKVPVQYTIENVVYLQRWGSRIGDMDAVMGHYGNKIYRHADELGKVASKEATSIHGKIKDKIEKYVEKRKMMKHKQEHDEAGVAYDEAKHERERMQDEYLEQLKAADMREEETEAEFLERKKREQAAKKKRPPKSFDSTISGG